MCRESFTLAGLRTQPNPIGQQRCGLRRITCPPQSATLLCAFREEMTVTATRIVAKIRRLAAGSMSVAMLYGKRDSALRCAWPARRVNLRLCEPWLLDDFPASGMKLRSSEADRQSAETNA